MANLVFASFSILLLASSILVSIPGTRCEVANVVGEGNGRRLLQESPSTTISRSGTSSSATATASVQGSGTTSAVAETNGCRVVASGGTVSSASCSEETAPGPETSGSGDDGFDIGFRGEDDTKYCTLCPEESGCEVCCCVDGECVDKKEARKGKAKCPQIALKGIPVTALECSHCEKSECDLYFHWCPKT